MELYDEILTKVLTENCEALLFSRMDFELDKIAKSECYKALKKIKEILEDDNLDDKECFMKIESIVRVFEEIGSDCGSRHDFS